MKPASAPWTAPAQPMREPFRVGRFRWRRQERLTAEVGSCPLVVALREREEAEIARRGGWEAQIPLLPVGPDVSGKLHRAVEFVRTRARLGFPVEAGLVMEDFGRGCCGWRQGDGVMLVFSLKFLARWDEAALRHRVAAMICGAMEPLGLFLGLFHGRRAPFLLETWEKSRQLMRLQEYSADCFAFACTGDLDAAVRDRFLLAAGCAPGEAGVDVRALAREAAESGAYSMGRQMTGQAPWPLWLPATHAVLEAFRDSEVCRECDGLPGGTPRAEFEEKLEALDAEAHKELDLDDLVVQVPFVNACGLLAGCAVIEATGRKPGEEAVVAAQALHFSENDLKQLVMQTCWEPAECGTSLTALKRLIHADLTRRRGLANVHSVTILGTALEVAVKHGGIRLEDMPAEPFCELGGVCGVPPMDLESVLRMLMGEPEDGGLTPE